MKHILWMMGGWIVLMILADGLYEGRMRSLEDILHDEINQAEMKTYHDEQYGYDIVYPKFFEVEEDGRNGVKRFAYHGLTNIAIDTFICRSIEHVFPQAKKKKNETGEVILDGDFQEDGRDFKNYRFHAKAVRSGKSWAVYRIVFQSGYEYSVQRLIRTVDAWNPLGCVK